MQVGGIDLPHIRLADQEGVLTELREFEESVIIVHVFDFNKKARSSKEATSINQMISLYNEKDALFIGISQKEPSLNKSYIKDNELKFDIFSDESGDAVEALGLLQENDGHKETIASTFIFNKKRKLVKRIDVSSPAEHGRHIYTALVNMNYDENINSGHRGRLRKRFIKRGFDAFSQHELVELMLFYVLPRRDTKELAKEMLRCYNDDFWALLEAKPEDIMRRCNITENVAVFFGMILKIAREYNISKWTPEGRLTDPEQAANHVKAILTAYTDEMFYIVCLDRQRKVKCFERVVDGEVDKVVISIKKVVEMAIVYKASYVIITHNHPGGSFLPSKNDINATIAIKEALGLVGITLLDHIIVAGTEHYSFAKKNLVGLRY